AASATPSGRPEMSPACCCGLTLQRRMAPGTISLAPFCTRVQRRVRRTQWCRTSSNSPRRPTSVWRPSSTCSSSEWWLGASHPPRARQTYSTSTSPPLSARFLSPPPRCTPHRRLSRLSTRSSCSHLLTGAPLLHMSSSDLQTKEPNFRAPRAGAGFSSSRSPRAGALFLDQAQQNAPPFSPRDRFQLRPATLRPISAGQLHSPKTSGHATTSWKDSLCSMLTAHAHSAPTRFRSTTTHWPYLNSSTERAQHG